MKIALIGDVHANLPALEAVLSHAAQNNAEDIWNVGDFVGYGPFPDEVVTRLRTLGATSILGNYDRKVLQVPQKEAIWSQKKDPQKWLAFKWAYEHLAANNRIYLQSLPETRRLKVVDWEILMVHGSPESADEHLNPDSPQKRLEELAEIAKADIVICGHSHQAFIRRAGQTWFINTGSTGRPDDGDPRACYALLKLEHGQREVVHYRLDYDIESSVQAIRAHGLPEEFAQVLTRGRSLSSIHILSRTHPTD